MEYTEISQPLALIFVTFFTGIICGAVWMFSTLKDYEKELTEELDAKNIRIKELEDDNLEKHYNQFKI